LIAFLVSDPAIARPSTDALRDRLATELPSYMVPAAFRWIDALPVSAGGKLNRAALPADEEPRSLAGRPAS
jgi:acyl-CoA synthetase (AMP-forming)/AMP-acid ligase II